MTTHEKFNAFHAANPIVFELFEQQALRAINAGFKVPAKNELTV